ncbi:unnamed protein product, partial [Tilletia laevis]
QTMSDLQWTSTSTALPVVGDLLTVNNVDSVIAISEDEPNEVHQFKFMAPVAAPWHLLLAWTRLVFRQYYSSSQIGTALSMDRLREMLNRGKTGLNDSEPQFNDGWALLRHTFEGRTLAALESTIDDQDHLNSWNPTKREFFSACRRVYREHISPEAIQTALRAKDQLKAASGLFLRDCLIGIEYEDATKTGDIGRMEMVEKYMLLGFAAVGSDNYKTMLLSRRLSAKVLPARALRVLRGAALVNRHGRDKGWEAADHLQETYVKEVKSSLWGQHGASLGTRVEDRISALPAFSQAVKLDASEQIGLDYYLRPRRAKDATRDIRMVQRAAMDTNLYTLTSDRSLEGAKYTKPHRSKDGVAVQAAWADFDAVHSKESVNDIIALGWIKVRSKGLPQFYNEEDALTTRESMLRTMLRPLGTDNNSGEGDDDHDDDEDDDAWDEADRDLRSRLARDREDGGLMHEL